MMKDACLYTRPLCSGGACEAHWRRALENRMSCVCVGGGGQHQAPGGGLFRIVSFY